MTRLHIPDLDGFVPTAGSQPATVRGKGKAGHHVSVTRQSMDLSARSDIPEPHALIRTRRGQPATVWTEGYGIDTFLVTAQPSNFLSCSYLPDPDGLVVTPRGQPPSIRTEGDVDHRPSERDQVAYRAPRRNVPQSNSLVIHARCQPVAIGAEGDRINPAITQDSQRLVASKCPDFPSCRSVPKCDSVGGILCGQPESVTTESKGLDLLHLAGYGAQLLPRRDVPELGGPVPASRG